MNILFLINRLRSMSFAEILSRMGKKAVSLYEMVFFPYMKFDNTVIHDGMKLLDFSRTDTAVLSGIIREADMICNNIHDIFSLRDMKLDRPINYHCDYKNLKLAPSDIFGKSIDYRDFSVVGDIKYIWEINRHLFLTKLALAFKTTNDQKYLYTFEELLTSWFRQNRFMLGVNWTSPLESAIRLINWTFCWQLLNNHISDEMHLQWLDSIHRHCWFICRNFSGYSSANNHLIGEAAGLFIAAVGLPRFKRTRKWLNKAYGILTAECLRQNYKDGVNKEQAVCYQQFVLDFLLLAGLTGKKAGIGFNTDYWNMIRKMLRFLAAIRDAEGNVPKFGDEDDGMVIDLQQDDFGACDSLLHTGSLLFGICGLEYAKDSHDLKTDFIYNMLGEGIHIPLSDSPEVLPVVFENGGYYILGNEQQKLVFDCGPLGYLSLAAHGHADALSFCFSAFGCPVFVDPGTYAYHTQRPWRDYFRGTSAHNTVCIDNTNQSEITGAFMWGKKAICRVAHSQAPYVIEASHDGYKGLRKGAVIHTRKIEYKDGDGIWEISDSIDCRNSHTVEVHFHLHPCCAAVFEGDHIEVRFTGGICRLYYDKGSEIRMIKGSFDPFSGWYSESFDRKTSCITIKMTRQISGPELIRTVFKVEPD